MNNIYALGKLIHLDPHTFWKHEAQNFTPWLAENIALLNEALGLEIEITDREVGVGDFAVDLLGKEVGSGLNVIIENQLEATDHTHLGQLLTYAAGLEASVVVWVSPRFRDEHMKAVNWLNSRTPDSLSFFAVQIELVQISGSLPAALFKVLAQPSEWTLDKGGGPAGTGVSTRRAAYHEFFIDLLARLKNASPGFTNTSRIGYDNWLGFSAGRTGFGYTVSFVSGDKFRVELYIDLGEQVTNKAVFDSFEQEAPQLESAMGEGLVWHRLDNRRASRICVERDGNIFSPDPLLDELKDWGVERLIRFREVFTSRLKTLVIPVLEAAEPQIESEELA